MPLAVNDEVLVSFKGTWNNQRILLTTSYKVSATASANTVPQDLATIGGWFNLGGAGAFKTNLLACLPTNYTLDSIRVQQVHPSRSVYVDTVAGNAGTFPATSTTGNLQHPITLHTNFGGRNQISVKKIGPAPNTSYLNGEPEPAYKAGPLAAFATELTQTQITLAPAITLVPIVPHPITAGTEVTGARLPSHTGTMRRRTVRVGE